MAYLEPAADSPPPTRSAVIVPIPAADLLVGPYRGRFDRAASWGVPAHVTVIYPFAAPGEIDDETVRTLAAVVRRIPAFDCRFARTEWFGPDLVWLAPEPDGPFRTLTTAVWDAFPGYPPYAGAHKDVVPHLTVAEARLGTAADLAAAERGVRGGLPLETRVEHAVLVAGAEARRSWRVLNRFPLGR